MDWGAEWRWGGRGCHLRGSRWTGPEGSQEDATFLGTYLRTWVFVLC